MNFLHLLTLIFVIAKLAGVITWSWGLVLLPSIISLVVGLLIFTVVAVAAIFAAGD